MTVAGDLEDRIEELGERYHYGDKENLLDDISKAYDVGSIDWDTAVALSIKVNRIAMEAFD